MTVQQLIDKLQTVKDKSKIVTSLQENATHTLLFGDVENVKLGLGKICLIIESDENTN
jgi:hypothetical protein